VVDSGSGTARHLAQPATRDMSSTLVADTTTLQLSRVAQIILTPNGSRVFLTGSRYGVDTHKPTVTISSSMPCNTDSARRGVVSNWTSLRSSGCGNLVSDRPRPPERAPALLQPDLAAQELAVCSSDPCLRQKAWLIAAQTGCHRRHGEDSRRAACGLNW